MTPPAAKVLSYRWRECRVERFSLAPEAPGAPPPGRVATGARAAGPGRGDAAGCAAKG
ncbi:MAG: hypothetical protein HY554_07755 [Elusimicrobia bacterium]|nr:hypothetical protein [Elusimicrobiota bacterium]